MGLIDKFKNMFTEEIEEDEVVVESKPQAKNNNVDVEIKTQRYVEPQKPVVTPVTTRSSYSRSSMLDLDDNDDILKNKDLKIEKEIIKQEEKHIQPIEEKKVMKREEKFVFPVYFDEKDFEKIEEKPKKVEEKKQPEKREVYGTKIEKKEQPKVFKPTPIISPIYGVLDKNYHKEDITSKKVVRSEYRNPDKPLTIDEVRKKAYGTLEDDIETSLIAKSSIFMETPSTLDEKEENKNSLLNDLIDDNEYSSVDEFLNSPIEDYKAKHGLVDDEFDINETLNNLENSVNKKIEKTKNDSETSSLDDLLKNNDYEDNMLEDYIMNNNSENEENNDDEDLTQSDLFNLIDSMYEKGDDL